MKWTLASTLLLCLASCGPNPSARLSTLNRHPEGYRSFIQGHAYVDAPIRNAVVQVRLRGNQVVLAETITDADGFFECLIEGFHQAEVEVLVFGEQAQWTSKFSAKTHQGIPHDAALNRFLFLDVLNTANPLWQIEVNPLASLADAWAQRALDSSNDLKITDTSERYRHASTELTHLLLGQPTDTLSVAGRQSDLNLITQALVWQAEALHLPFADWFKTLKEDAQDGQIRTEALRLYLYNALEYILQTRQDPDALLRWLGPQGRFRRLLDLEHPWLTPLPQSVDSDGPLLLNPEQHFIIGRERRLTLLAYDRSNIAEVTAVSQHRPDIRMQAEIDGEIIRFDIDPRLNAAQEQMLNVELNDAFGNRTRVEIPILFDDTPPDLIFGALVSESTQGEQGSYENDIYAIGLINDPSPIDFLRINGEVVEVQDGYFKHRVPFEYCQTLTMNVEISDTLGNAEVYEHIFQCSDQASLITLSLQTSRLSLPNALDTSYFSTERTEHGYRWIQTQRHTRYLEEQPIDVFIYLSQWKAWRTQGIDPLMVYAQATIGEIDTPIFLSVNGVVGDTINSGPSTLATRSLPLDFEHFADEMNQNPEMIEFQIQAFLGPPQNNQGRSATVRVHLIPDPVLVARPHPSSVYDLFPISPFGLAPALDFAQVYGLVGPEGLRLEVPNNLAARYSVQWQINRVRDKISFGACDHPNVGGHHSAHEARCELTMVQRKAFNTLFCDAPDSIERVIICDERDDCNPNNSTWYSNNRCWKETRIHHGMFHLHGAQSVVAAAKTRRESDSAFIFGHQNMFEKSPPSRRAVFKDNVHVSKVIELNECWGICQAAADSQIYEYTPYYDYQWLNLWHDAHQHLERLKLAIVLEDQVIEYETHAIVQDPSLKQHYTLKDFPNGLVNIGSP